MSLLKDVEDKVEAIVKKLDVDRDRVVTYLHHVLDNLLGLQQEEISDVKETLNEIAENAAQAANKAADSVDTAAAKVEEVAKQ